MHRLWLIGVGALFVFLWSSGWTVSHFAVTDAPATAVLSARYLIVFICIFFIVTLLGHWRKVALGDLLMHLAIGALCHSLYLLAGLSAFEQGAPAAAVAFTNSLQPMVTVVFASLVTNERVKLRQLNGLVLGLLSTAIVVSSTYQSGVSVQTLLLPGAAMIVLAFGTVLNKRQEVSALRRGKMLPLSLVLLIHCAGALIVILPMAVTQGQLQLQFTPVEWGSIVWLAIGVSIGGYGLFFLLIRHTSTLQAASLNYFIPLATILQGYILFDTPITQNDLFALCIAMFAVFLIMSPAKRRTATATQMRNGSADVAKWRLKRVVNDPAQALDFEVSMKA